MSESEWVLCSLNPRLMPLFLQQLKENFQDQEFDIYLDPQINGNKIIVSKSFLNILRSRLDPKFFYNYRVRLHLNALSPQIDLEKFLKCRKSLNQVKILPGSMVRLQMDGMLYVVQSINESKKTAVINRVSKTGPSVSIRVPIKSIVPTFHDET